MDASFTKLLSMAYELEGLLLVAEKGDNGNPQLVLKLIKDKAQHLAELARDLRLPEIQKHPASAPAETQPPFEAASQPEPQPTTSETSAPKSTRLPSEDYDADETWQHDNGEEPQEIFSIGSQHVEPKRIVQPATANAGESKADDDADDDHDTRAVTACDTPHASTPASDIALDDEEEQENNEDLRVDEKLQRDLSKDMRQALSVNDRFRFRRELFSNSDYELTDALDMVQSMKSFDEATEYFYDDLGWNQDNEDVKAFMEIVRKHFL